MRIRFRFAALLSSVMNSISLGYAAAGVDLRVGPLNEAFAAMMSGPLRCVEAHKWARCQHGGRMDYG